MKIRTACPTLALLAALGAPLPALAQSVADGIGLRQAGAFEEAYGIFRQHALEGHAEAQYLLGNLYASGAGIARDAAEAMRWYSLAAGQGQADAMFAIGAIYRDGDGVAADAAEALRWFSRAAGLGQVDAQYVLGVIYRDGNGVEPDPAEAMRWFSRAAEQGDDWARQRLAEMRGEFLPDAPVCAALYANIAVNQSFVAPMAREMAALTSSLLTSSLTDFLGEDPNAGWRDFGPFWAFSNARDIDFSARRDTLRARAANELAFDIAMHGISGGSRFPSPASAEAGFGGSQTVPRDAVSPRESETPPYGQWIAACDVAHGFAPVFGFGVADAAAPVEALTSFWPAGQSYPDMAGLTDLYRSAPEGAAASVQFLAGRIAAVRAGDSMQQGYADTRALIEHGFITLMGLADEEDRRAGRQMFDSALNEANTLLPEGGTIPGFLFIWMDPDGLVSPPEHLMP